MGHVNNAVIMEDFDLGKEAFFLSHGLSPEEGDFTVVVVHCEVDFRRQIHHRDSIAVGTTLEHIGHKSLTLRQSVFDTASGTPYAECRTVLSGYRRSTAAAEVIPDEVRQWINA